jgi:hypothetical protein
MIEIPKRDRINQKIPLSSRPTKAPSEAVRKPQIIRRVIYGVTEWSGDGVWQQVAGGMACTRFG